ncbi:MAG: hypothetical protein R2764_09425 [Bacteroidales bacterium]
MKRLATTIARQAGLLLNDGSIVSTDGSSTLSFTNSISNSLFAVVHHRNHLAVMSANPVILNGEIYAYDFTSTLEQAYGSNAQKQLSTGQWGMISGDCDANGNVGNEDINPGWSTDAGKAGYYPADLNLDQQVDNQDKDSFWLPNMGKEPTFLSSSLFIAIIPEGKEFQIILRNCFYEQTFLSIFLSIRKCIVNILFFLNLLLAYIQVINQLNP